MSMDYVPDREPIVLGIAVCTSFAPKVSLPGLRRCIEEQLIPVRSIVFCPVPRIEGALPGVVGARLHHSPALPKVQALADSLGVPMEVVTLPDKDTVANLGNFAFAQVNTNFVEAVGTGGFLVIGDIRSSLSLRNLWHKVSSAQGTSGKLLVDQEGDFRLPEDRLRDDSALNVVAALCHGMFRNDLSVMPEDAVRLWNEMLGELEQEPWNAGRHAGCSGGSCLRCVIETHTTAAAGLLSQDEENGSEG